MFKINLPLKSRTTGNRVLCFGMDDMTAELTLAALARETCQHGAHVALDQFGVCTVCGRIVMAANHADRWLKAFSSTERTDHGTDSDQTPVPRVP